MPINVHTWYAKTMLSTDKNPPHLDIWHNSEQIAITQESKSEGRVNVFHAFVLSEL